MRAEVKMVTLLHFRPCPPASGARFLEQRHIKTGASQKVCGGKPRQSSADNRYVRSDHFLFHHPISPENNHVGAEFIRRLRGSFSSFQGVAHCDDSRKFVFHRDHVCGGRKVTVISVPLAVLISPSSAARSARRDRRDGARVRAAYIQPCSLCRGRFLSTAHPSMWRPLRSICDVPRLTCSRSGARLLHSRRSPPGSRLLPARSFAARRACAP